MSICIHLQHAQVCAIVDVLIPWAVQEASFLELRVLQAGHPSHWVLAAQFVHVFFFLRLAWTCLFVFIWCVDCFPSSIIHTGLLGKGWKRCWSSRACSDRIKERRKSLALRRSNTATVAATETVAASTSTTAKPNSHDELECSDDQEPTQIGKQAANSAIRFRCCFCTLPLACSRATNDVMSWTPLAKATPNRLSQTCIATSAIESSYRYRQVPWLSEFHVNLPWNGAQWSCHTAIPCRGAIGEQPGLPWIANICRAPCMVPDAKTAVWFQGHPWGSELSYRCSEIAIVKFHHISICFRGKLLTV